MCNSFRERSIGAAEKTPGEERRRIALLDEPARLGRAEVARPLEARVGYQFCG
jgi:hypothetical protein